MDRSSCINPRLRWRQRALDARSSETMRFRIDSQQNFEEIQCGYVRNSFDTSILVLVIVAQLQCDSSANGLPGPPLPESAGVPRNPEPNSGQAHILTSSAFLRFPDAISSVKAPCSRLNQRLQCRFLLQTKSTNSATCVNVIEVLYMHWRSTTCRRIDRSKSPLLVVASLASTLPSVCTRAAFLIRFTSERQVFVRLGLDLGLAPMRNEQCWRWIRRFILPSKELQRRMERIISSGSMGT